VLKLDDIRAVQQRIDQREPDGVGFGARGRRTDEPGLATRQLAVGGDPPLPRTRVERDVLSDGCEAGCETDLLADPVELLPAEPPAERQRLRSPHTDDHKAIEESVRELGRGEMTQQLPAW
jgi:hypothetical protein